MEHNSVLECRRKSQPCTCTIQFSSLEPREGSGFETINSALSCSILLREGQTWSKGQQYPPPRKHAFLYFLIQIWTVLIYPDDRLYFIQGKRQTFKSNRQLFYAIILTTAACLPVQGSKGQSNGSLENRSQRVQGSN